MFSAIVALDEQNSIGKNGDLLCHLSDDLKRFKQITWGNKIIMGRKTFEALPQVLPNREHIVLTKNKDFKINSIDVKVSYNIEDVIDKFKDIKEEVFIIGGGEIYRHTIDYCKKLYVTKIFHEFEGDTFFPPINEDIYNVFYKSEIIIDKKTNIKYQYKDYILK